MNKSIKSCPMCRFNYDKPEEPEEPEEQEEQEESEEEEESEESEEESEEDKYYDNYYKNFYKANEKLLILILDEKENIKKISINEKRKLKNDFNELWTKTHNKEIKKIKKEYNNINLRYLSNKVFDKLFFISASIDNFNNSIEYYNCTDTYDYIYNCKLNKLIIKNSINEKKDILTNKIYNYLIDLDEEELKEFKDKIITLSLSYRMLNLIGSDLMNKLHIHNHFNNNIYKGNIYKEEVLMYYKGLTRQYNSGLYYFYNIINDLLNQEEGD